MVVLLVAWFLGCIACMVVVELGVYIGEDSKCKRQNDDMIVLSSDRSLWFPALTSVKNIVMEWARRVFTSVCTTLLCVLVQRLFITYLCMIIGVGKCRFAESAKVVES